MNRNQIVIQKFFLVQLTKRKILKKFTQLTDFSVRFVNFSISIFFSPLGAHALREKGKCCEGMGGLGEVSGAFPINCWTDREGNVLSFARLNFIFSIFLKNNKQWRCIFRIVINGHHSLHVRQLRSI